MAVILLTSNNVGTMKITRICKVAAFAALAVMSISCEEEGRMKSEKGFSFKVKAVESIETKAGSSVESCSTDISFNGIMMTLTASAEPNYSDPFDTYRTKGTQINSSDALDSFSMIIEQAVVDYDTKYDYTAKVAKSEGSWGIVHSSAAANIQWPDVVPDAGIRFDSYYTEGATFGIAGNVASYSSTVSSSADSKDLLFGRTYAKENQVPVTLYHPLSAIKFKVKGLVDGVSVASITVKGVIKDGTFTIPTSTSLGTTDLSNIAWTLTSTDGADFSCVAEDDLFVIPQSVENIKLEIVFNQPNGADPQTMTVDFPAAGLDDTTKAWKAGYFYTYTISGGGFIDVETSGFNSENKVTVSNTGSLPAYVRAAVICGWYKPTNGSTEVEFYTGAWNGAATVLNTWTLKADGFYYYNQALPVGATVDFVSAFTDGSAPVGKNSSILSKSVSVQAVYDNSVWNN